MRATFALFAFCSLSIIHLTHACVSGVTDELALVYAKTHSDQSGTFFSAQSPIFWGAAIGEQVPLSMNS
jgi:hypothetical protein